MIPKAHQDSFEVILYWLLYYCSDNFLIAHIFKSLQIIYLEYNADFDAFQLNLNKKFLDKEYFFK